MIPSNLQSIFTRSNLKELPKT